MRLAEEKGIKSVAFPSISTGVFGYPLPEAAQIALETVVKEAGQLKAVRTVRFVLFGESALQAHREVLGRIEQ